MTDVSEHSWYCERPSCDFHIGKIWKYRIEEHLLEHERADVSVAGALAKAQADVQLWKARLFDHLYNELGPARARYYMEKYEKRARLGTP